MRWFLFASLAAGLAAQTSAATLLGNAQCRASSDPASRVVEQLWGGDQVRVIGDTTGFVRIDRGPNGCWVSVGMIGYGGSPTPPLIDRGAVREQCQCRDGRVCTAPSGRRFCLNRKGDRRWRR